MHFFPKNCQTKTQKRANKYKKTRKKTVLRLETKNDLPWFVVKKKGPACAKRKKNCEKTHSTSPKLNKRLAPKVGSFAANFACGFSEVWRGGTRFLIIVLAVFACRPLILSDDSNVFRGLEGGITLSHSYFRGFRTQATNSFLRH